MGSNRGASLVSVLVATFLVVTGLYVYVRGASSSVRADEISRDGHQAQLFVEELLERFRAFDGASALIPYLSVNPKNAALPPYFFCAHINILDRNTGTIVNPDSIADLPASNSLLHPNGNQYAPNRFYQFNVIDMVSLVVNKTVCNQTAQTVTLAENERILITVGVSWVPVNGEIADVQRVVLSNLIPGV